jgi:hypothetical protein
MKAKYGDDPALSGRGGAKRLAQGGYEFTT